MSRSKKDGRRGGGHRNTQGKEYWAARPGYPMAEPGRVAKTRTHRLERRAARKLTQDDEGSSDA